MKKTIFLLSALFLIIMGCGTPKYIVKIDMLRDSIVNSDYDTAKADIMAFIDKYPGKPEPYLFLGFINFNAGKYSDCLLNFDEAERRNIEKTSDFYLKKGIALYQTGQNMDAEKNLIQSVELTQSGTAQKYLGLTLYELSDYSGSAVAFGKASDISNDPSALYFYGMALYYEGMNSEALDILMRAYNISSEDKILFQTANLLMLDGRIKEAVSMYSKIPSSSLYAPESLYNSAESYITSGDYGTAAKLLEKYIELRPDDNEALLNLSSALIKAGEYVYAADILSDLLEKDYGVKAVYNYGIVNHKLGKYAESIYYLAEAAALNPKNIEYLYAYGITLSEYGDIENARAQMEAVTALHPENKDAAEWLNQHIPAD